MSFSFSQSLLDDLPSSNPGDAGSFSQELENSQDSGYSVCGGTQALSSNFPRIASTLPQFPTRRTLPRPPTWPNINAQQQQPQQKGGNKWRFGSRQEKEGRSALERDLQQHLQEISKQANKVPVKLSTVVVESVKYMQEVYSKEGQDYRKELDKLENAMYGLKQQIKDKECDNTDIIEDLTNLQTVLTECELLCKKVTDKKEKNNQRLSRLQDQIQRSSFSQTKIEEVIKRFPREETDVLTGKKRTEMNGSRYSLLSPPPPKRQALANPLPSIRRLPTLPLLTTAAAPCGVRKQQGGVIGSREETLDHGRRTVRMRRFWGIEE